MKLAMINLQADLESRKLKTKLTMQVHDELILDVPADEIKEAQELLLKAMTLGQPLLVPLKVDIHAGKNWMEAK